MKIIYNTGIFLAFYILKCIAFFNSKIKKGVIGRASTFETLHTNISKTHKTLWFHCASLGEYEQGLPVFIEIKNQYPDHKVVLSFFSPSGYEIRKNSPIADVVVYLPLDSKSNAKKFVDAIHPELSVFVKYDLWPNMLSELKKRNAKTILISAVFRKKQLFFKSYGKFMREALFAFQHIFTQDENSKLLLESINYNTVSVAGDTRFDRVTNQLSTDNNLDFIAAFKQDNLCFVAGSSWPEDEKLLINYINNEAPKHLKFIIAPHNIKSGQIKSLKNNIHLKTVLYSEKNGTDLSTYQVFIIDTIGILSKIYNYADIAYIGGAMGNTGLHNTLEAAVFGVPVIIGKNYNKFLEAKAMIANKGMFSVCNQSEFNAITNKLINDENFRKTCGTLNASFIKNNTGAVNQISNYLRISN